MLRAIVARKYIHGEIEHIVGHNAVVYIRWMFLNLFLLITAYGLRTVADNIWEGHEYVALIFWLLWVWLLLKYVVDFLNNYLDALIVTEHGIVVFRREWILEYKTEMFEWEKIELISHEQKSFLDKLFFKWDIVISLDYNTAFKFENISNPQKAVSVILMKKHRFQQDDDIVDESWWWEWPHSEKFDVLVETLGEVIQDYMKKWQWVAKPYVSNNAPRSKSKAPVVHDEEWDDIEDYPY